MVDSDTETLVEEPISPPKPGLGKRGREWRDKLVNGILFRTTVVLLKTLGLTDDEIIELEPDYFYEEDYHGLTWLRRTKSLADLSSATGTSQGYSGWEWHGEPLS